VVRSADDRREALVSDAEAALGLGLADRGFASSALPGPKSHRESYIWCGAEGPGVEDLESAAREVEP
jgi:hypothetical protein